jgi:hypothetical protein
MPCVLIKINHEIRESYYYIFAEVAKRHSHSVFPGIPNPIITDIHVLRDAKYDRHRYNTQTRRDRSTPILSPSLLHASGCLKSNVTTLCPRVPRRV